MLNMVIGAVANWVTKYRRGLEAENEFKHCSPGDVKRTANDLGISSGELIAIAGKGPGSAELLQKLLVALGIDPKEIANYDPATMQDLRRLCVSCGNKDECRQNLDAGTATAHFHAFCPNAFTIDALFMEQTWALSQH
jgi:hypothetical protein